MQIVSILFATAVALSSAYAASSNWAVLVAGSNGFWNYRHQADVCHAYHVLRSKGFPEDRIITLMYDDIANNPQNPKLGQIFNKPGGNDVYANVTIDYKGESVTPSTFLNVLLGNETGVAGLGSGKVLKSTSEDNVFIFYDDHGSFGSIGMPAGGFLYSDQLNKTLNEMAERKMFKKLLFYMEACESGSMFNQILNQHENILAFTAANPTESSYAVYYDNVIGTYLGDEFSVNWMEDSDVEDFSIDYKIQQQFDKVVNETKQSHVQEYGQADLLQLDVSDFQAFEFKKPSFISRLRRLGLRRPRPTSGPSVSREDAVSTRDVTLEILRRQFEAETDPHMKQIKRVAYENEIKRRESYDTIFSRIVRTLSGLEHIEHPQAHIGPQDFECLRDSVEYFTENCLELDGYGAKYVKTLSSLCDNGYCSGEIAEAIKSSCTVELW